MKSGKPIFLKPNKKTPPKGGFSRCRPALLNKVIGFYGQHEKWLKTQNKALILGLYYFNLKILNPIQYVFQKDILIYLFSHVLLYRDYVLF